MTRTLVAALALVALTGCAAAAYSPRVANGYIYADTKSNEGVTGATLGPKTGEACSKSILGLVTTGDATVPTAMKNGGIKKVSSVDNRYEQILGVVATYCVVVTGE
jgi:hypothetical protein